MEIIYGTGNPAKIAYMKRALTGLPFRITGAVQAAEERNLRLPEVEENGETLLENARYKAEAYFELFRAPVFSCDSGLYLRKGSDQSPLPEEEQPGIHVRGREIVRYSDEDLLKHYVELVRKYGPLRARYKNAICLIWNERLREESMGEELWGKEFLLTEVPHTKRVKGFPLDSISIDPDSGRYFYDLDGEGQDRLVSDVGFGQFFRHFLELHNVLR